MRNTLLAFVLCLAAPSVWAQAGKADVLAPKPRSVIMSNAASILTRRDSLTEEIPVGVKNPFNPAADDSADRAKVKVVRSEKELISLLASQLLPTGSAERDGARFLLLGQRKVKVGDHVPILFENVQYDVEISAIEGATFTIRCRNEEFTRPIKPGKNQ
jgi:hypothetical protein